MFPTDVSATSGLAQLQRQVMRCHTCATRVLCCRCVAHFWLPSDKCCHLTTSCGRRTSPCDFCSPEPPPGDWVSVSMEVRQSHHDKELVRLPVALWGASLRDLYASRDAAKNVLGCAEPRAKVPSSSTLVGSVVPVARPCSGRGGTLRPVLGL